MSAAFWSSEDVHISQGLRPEDVGSGEGLRPNVGYHHLDHAFLFIENFWK
jgi:hypothetical protein